MEKVYRSLSRLETSHSLIESLGRDIYTSFLRPVLSTEANEKRSTLVYEGNSVRVQSTHSDKTVSSIFESILTILKYLYERLPSDVTNLLFARIAPTIVTTIIDKIISPLIPMGVTGMREFQSVVDQVRNFSTALSQYGCDGAKDLATWEQQIPRLWLSQRRIRTLDEVRLLLLKCHGQVHKVERQEKGSVPQENDLTGENRVDEDWDAEWSDDNETSDNANKAGQSHDAEEDVSAWGLDDDTEDTGVDIQKDIVEEEEDAGEAWGWGDEDDAGETNGNLNTTEPSPGAGVDATKPPRGNEIILKEYYSVSDIPQHVFAIISDQFSDSETLKKPE